MQHQITKPNKIKKIKSPKNKITFCTYCKKRGHTLNECYKKPQKTFKITKKFNQTQTYGWNGAVIIGLVRRQNNNQINIISKNDETEIKIYSNQLNDTYISMLKLYLENPNPTQPHKDINLLNSIKIKSTWLKQ